MRGRRVVGFRPARNNAPADAPGENVAPRWLGEPGTKCCLPGNVLRLEPAKQKAPNRTISCHRGEPARRALVLGSRAPASVGARNGRGARSLRQPRAHARVMSFPPPQPGQPRYGLDGHELIADWTCPVCEAPTPRTRRPGRPSVYCSNSCRQRAYRTRRRCGIRLLRGDGQPSERATGTRVRHLLRAAGDPIRSRRRSDRKTVSLCGAFVRPARDHPDLYIDFAFDDADACYTCLQLTGSPRPDPPMIYPWQASRKSYAGPPVEKVPAPAAYAANLRGVAQRRTR